MQQKPAIKTVLGTAAAAAVFALSACNGGGSPEPSKSATGDKTSAPSSASSSGSSSDSTGKNDHLLKAGRKALDKVSDSTLISIETENNDKRWEVQVVTSDGTEHEMKIAGDGSKIISGPQKKDEDSDDKAKHRRRVKNAKLDYRDAVKAVNKAVHGRITELDIDTDNDTTVWEADVKKNGTKYEVSVDAASGKVLQKEKD